VLALLGLRGLVVSLFLALAVTLLGRNNDGDWYLLLRLIIRIGIAAIVIAVRRGGDVGRLVLRLEGHANGVSLSESGSTGMRDYLGSNRDGCGLGLALEGRLRLCIAHVR
jgi:hypothetical protein